MSKRVMLLVTGLFVSSLATAADDWKKRCSSMGDLAEQIMGARQDGIAMSKMIETAQGQLTETMIMGAYERPRYNTEANRKREIGDYRDAWYLRCVKLSNKKK